MWKVVIVDDEPIIVEGLSKAIKWDDYNCTVVGFAYNGVEGLELIKKESPDIIFSDISMPNMDGLKMIAAIKSTLPNTQITILTGFRNFDYAKEAISLGVTRYLLKPSKFDELIEAINVMTEKLKSIAPVEEAAAEESDSFADESIDLQNPANSFIVKNAMEYINDHYSEKLKLLDVAEQIYVSQWHLSKLLNKHTGKNFSEILNGIRIDKAKELLKNPSYRICDIAEEVGFTDLTHFSRVFKKTEGISANEYRNKL
ncbi:MAG: response regulator [Lachnospiraceae bacterium]|nr:response regulator [Lachnospiraceae bacterium]